MGELFGLDNDEKENGKPKEEPKAEKGDTGSMGGLFGCSEGEEEISSAPSKQPAREGNPFENEDEYGKGHEFYMRHEKLSINYKLFKEHYQSTKRITEYRISQSLKQSKTENFEKNVPEGFGVELQRFIQRHPEKDQKILIAIISEHDFGLLPNTVELKSDRASYKNYLSNFLKKATNDYREYKGYSDFPSDQNQGNSDDDEDQREQGPISEENQENDEEDDDEGSAGSEERNDEDDEEDDEEEDESGNDNDDVDEPQSINQIELNEEEKNPEEPQEENKQSSGGERKRAVSKKEPPTKSIDSEVRKMCEEVIDFSIIDDHFLMLLLSQLCLNSNELKEVSDSLRKICISPEIELKVISIILFALENHKSSSLAAFLNKYSAKFGAETSDKNLRLFGYLKESTSDKVYIPNDLLDAYKPESIKALMIKDETGASIENGNIMILLDRVICLLKDKELMENTDLHLDTLNYILDALQNKKFEIISAEKTLSVEELLLREDTAISSNSLRLLLEECAFQEQNYSTVKEIFDVLCKDRTLLKKNIGLTLAVCVEKVVKFTAQLENGVPKLKQVPHLGQKIMLGVQITKGLKPLHEFLKGILNHLFLRIKGKVKMADESKKEKSEKELQKEKKRAEYGKTVEPLIDEVLNNQNVLEFIFNIFEILVQYAKFYSEDSKGEYEHEHLLPMVSILCSFYGLYSLSKHIKADPAAQQIEKEKAQEATSTKSLDSLPELQAMPKLSRFVSKEGDVLGMGAVTFNRSVSQIKRQTVTANIQEIFHECLYKIKDLTDLAFANLSQDDRKEGPFVDFIKAFPYLTDLKTKEKITK